MANRCTYEQRLEVEGSRVVRIIKAKWLPRGKLKYEFDVYKEYCDGRIFQRNLYQTQMLGYVVGIPGEKYYQGLHTLEEFMPVSQLNIYCGETIAVSDELKRVIVALNQDLKYLFLKSDTSNKLKSEDPKLILDLIRTYRIYANIEFLVEQEQYQLALSQRIQTLSKPKLKQVLSFVKETNESNMQLAKILFCMSNKIPYKDYKKYQPYGSKKTYEYLQKQGEDLEYYKDYKTMAKTLNKNLNDPYWKYPRSLSEFHDNFVRQIELIEQGTKNAEIIRKNHILKNLRTMFSVDKKIGDYFFFIPSCIKVFQKQAKDLKQCLMSADYPTKMTNRDTTLVFIWKNRKPIATAQITNLKEKKIGQFYGDESDRDNCKPDEETTKVFHEWLKQVNFIGEQKNDNKTKNQQL